MAKVRVLYPTAFAAIGVEAEGGEVVTLDDAKAATLVAVGYAELVSEPKMEPEPKPEPKPEPRSARKATK